MASKKHRKRLKRIHLVSNPSKYLNRAEKIYFEAMESLAKAAESAAKIYMKMISNMEILKTDEGEDFITCESCTKQCTDIESMECDDGSNWFCAECWEELAPGLKAEYAELKANGEID